MSERTAPALARIDELLPRLKAQPATPENTDLLETAEALRRAVAAFHMEAIRFRMYGVERALLRMADAESLRIFGEVREALEKAGFHTRSHAAP
jgi:hypothetical protein